MKQNKLLKIDEARATDAELYRHLQNDPARYTEVMTHRYDGTKKPKNYPKEITRIVKVEKPKKVAEKPKANGKYEMPKINMDSFDWDMWLREKDKNYKTLEDEKKIVSEPSIEASNAEWWENEFLDYKKDGGPLPFLKFKEMMLNEADLEFSKQIDKRVKDKIKDEGLSEEFTKQKIMEGKFL